MPRTPPSGMPGFSLPVHVPTSAHARSQKIKNLSIQGNGGSPVRIGSAITMQCCGILHTAGLQYERTIDMFLDWLAQNRGGIRVGGELRPLQIILYDNNESQDKS